MLHSFLLATALLGSTTAAAFAQASEEKIAVPTLRANVSVSADVVRIGDVIDNAGPSAQIAIYRAPDLGTTGSLPTAQVIATLRGQRVIGVDTRDIKEVSVTRLARTLEARDIETAIARALEHRNGLGDAANLSLTPDRDVGDIRLDASNSGPLQPVSSRFDPRSGRFDVTFEIANAETSAPTRMRFTGRAVETVEVTVLMRDIERNDIIKAGDLTVERRPKADVSGDPAARDRAVGMQLRRPIRAGQALRVADLVRPDLVQRDQGVTLIYEASGLYLTIRGKALDGGAEGDVVNVLNLQSKRTMSGVVIGRGQVSISAATPQLPAGGGVTSSVEPEKPVSLAANSTPQVSSRPE